MRTRYPHIRRALNADCARVHESEIPGLVSETFPGRLPEDVEDFLSTLTKAAQVAAPIAQKALPGAIQGAVQGGMVAGPYGAIAGAVAGGAISALSKPKPKPPAAQPQSQRTTQPVSQPVRTAPPIRTAHPAQPVGVANLTAAQVQAAQQLMALLARPETIQALSALSLGLQGRPTVGSKRHAVPTRSVVEAIAELADQASGKKFASQSWEHVDEDTYRMAAHHSPENGAGTLAAAVMHDFAKASARRARMRRRVSSNSRRLQ